MTGHLPSEWVCEEVDIGQLAGVWTNYGVGCSVAGAAFYLDTMASDAGKNGLENGVNQTSRGVLPRAMSRRAGLLNPRRILLHTVWCFPQRCALCYGAKIASHSPQWIKAARSCSRGH